MTNVGSSCPLQLPLRGWGDGLYAQSANPPEPGLARSPSLSAQRQRPSADSVLSRWHVDISAHLTPASGGLGLQATGGLSRGVHAAGGQDHGPPVNRGLHETGCEWNLRHGQRGRQNRGGSSWWWWDHGTDRRTVGRGGAGGPELRLGLGRDGASARKTHSSATTALTRWQDASTPNLAKLSSQQEVQIALQVPGHTLMPPTAPRPWLLWGAVQPHASRGTDILSPHLKRCDMTYSLRALSPPASVA